MKNSNRKIRSDSYLLKAMKDIVEKGYFDPSLTTASRQVINALSWRLRNHYEIPLLKTREGIYFPSKAGRDEAERQMMLRGYKLRRKSLPTKDRPESVETEPLVEEAPKKTINLTNNMNFFKMANGEIINLSIISKITPLHEGRHQLILGGSIYYISTAEYDEIISRIDL